MQSRANWALRPDGSALRDIGRGEHGFAAAELPADHFDRHGRTKHHSRRLRVTEDVVLRGRGDIADTARGAPHHDAATDPARHVGRLGEREGHIRQRSEGDEGEPLVLANDVDDRVDGVLPLGRAARRRIAAVPEPVIAVEPLCRQWLADERRGRALEDGDVLPAELHREPGVAAPLKHRHVAGDDRDRLHHDVVGHERHDERDRVVGGCVGVDQEALRVRHGRTVHQPA